MRHQRRRGADGASVMGSGLAVGVSNYNGRRPTGEKTKPLPTVTTHPAF